VLWSYSGNGIWRGCGACVNHVTVFAITTFTSRQHVGASGGNVGLYHKIRVFSLCFYIFADAVSPGVLSECTWAR